MTLLRGLSINSASVTSVSARHHMGGVPGKAGKRQPVVTVEGPRAAQAAFDSIFKGRGKSAVKQ